MATEEQIKANRENSMKSTGPNDTSLTRFNATRHGMTAGAVLIRGENAEEFEALNSEVVSELAPVGIIEGELVKQIVLCLWKLRRAPRAEKAIADINVGLDKELKWSSVFGDDNLSVISRYETRATRQLIVMMDVLSRRQDVRLGKQGDEGGGEGGDGDQDED